MFNQLNPQQAKFVLSPLENALVLAGAGTGKTSSFIARIAHLIINNQITLHSFFATTFTNAAAKEMRDRLLWQLKKHNPNFNESQLRQCYIGTFHSLFGRILRNNIDKLNDDIRPNFTNLEEATAKSRIREFLKQNKLNETFEKQGLNPGSILNIINTIRETYIIDNEFNMQIFNQVFRDYQKASIKLDDENPESVSAGDISLYDSFKKVFDFYHRYKIDNNLVDFTDYLIKTYKLLKNNPQVLKSLQKRFTYLIVDECQDINNLQYELIKLLQNPEYNRVAMIGDDDQAIYGFRGSNVTLLLRFEREIKDVQVYKLEYNYRSSPSILNMANHIINLYKEDNIKVLQATKASSKNTPVRYLEVQGQDNIQGELIAQDLLRHGEFTDAAILARNNKILQNFEQYLIQHKIPYEFKTSAEFFNRLEVKIIMHILTLVNNPNANESFNYLVENLVAKVGPKVISQINELGRQLGLPNYLAARDYISMLWKSITVARQNLQEFIERIEEVRHFSFTATIEDTIKHTARIFDLENWFKAKKDNAESRLENIQALYDLASNYTPQILDDEETEATELDFLRLQHGNLTDLELRNLYIQRQFIQQNFLDQVNLGKDPNTPKGVILSTIHRAKGLEWKHVYLPDFCDKTMPSPLSESDKELEEERRLFYVAITRAKEYLYLLKPEIYRGYAGYFENAERSEFTYDFLCPELSKDIEFYQQVTFAGNDYQRIDFSRGLDKARKASVPYEQLPPILQNSASHEPSRGQGLGSNFSFNNKRRTAPIGAIASQAPTPYRQVEKVTAKTLDQTIKDKLSRLASNLGLNLPIVQANLADFVELVKAYKLVHVQQILYFSSEDLALHPQLRHIAPIFAQQVQETADLSLGQAVYACNFKELDDAAMLVRICRFFKNAQTMFRYIENYATAVDFAQEFVKYKVPEDLSRKIYHTFSQERNQEILWQLLDAGVAQNTLNDKDQETLSKRQQLGVVDELEQEIAQKRAKLESEDPFGVKVQAQKVAVAQEFLDTFNGAKKKLYEQEYSQTSLEALMDDIFSQSTPVLINRDNLKNYSVSFIGRHPYLSYQEVLDSLESLEVTYVQNPNHAQVVFVFDIENQNQEYMREAIEENQRIEILSLKDFERIFS
ncbi:hypothetical protein CJP74_03725 [Psittacicella melopsittaci]|uniref:DNA 3'-5' helicase n=1 Tax=Psittacicella melopsittaci TaxID=2028576 RepID=A0A3A1Y9B0_9GAMM|nr:ATP-dependent helicase [Psittacicella melopsittaci]RIY32724.1 hypothetical protein CJP74_03725 [Psittacicella melopsittaci]